MTRGTGDAMQHNTHAERKPETADEARLLMRLKPMEVHGFELQSPVGACDSSLWPKIWPWVLERHVALEDKKNKENEEI